MGIQLQLAADDLRDTMFRIKAEQAAVEAWHRERNAKFARWARRVRFAFDVVQLGLMVLGVLWLCGVSR